MRWWLLIGAALLGVAALSVYMAFQSPEFVWGLVGVMLVAAYQAIVPVLEKRLPQDEEAAWREAEKAGRGEEWLRKRRGAPPNG